MRPILAALSLLIVSCPMMLSCKSQSLAAAKHGRERGGIVGSWRSKEYPGLTCEFKTDGTYHATLSYQEVTVFADSRYSIAGRTFTGEAPDNITGSNDNRMRVLMFGIMRRTNPPKGMIAWKSDDEFKLTSRNEMKGVDESVTWERQHLPTSGSQSPYRRQTLGRLGHKLEIRLLAVRQSSYGPQTGEDIFPLADADKWSESGEAPNGWLWMPVMNSLREEARLPTIAVQRVREGRLYGLVTDQRSNSLADRTDMPRWAVRSVKVVEDVSSVAKLVGIEVKLDSAGGKLLKDLSSRYRMHYLAIAIGGQIVIAPQLKSALDEGTFDI